MKKITLLVSLLIGSALSFSQYTFSKTTGTYSDLVSPTSLSNGATWDDPQYTIPLGFNFDYFNSTINQIFIAGYGLGSYLAVDTANTGLVSYLIPYGADLADRGYDDNVGSQSTGGLSPISYLLTGTVGSRIMKIEWKNAGFYSDIDDDGTSTDFTNFQLWLYEGTNNIEIHFGSNSILQTSLCFDGETGSSVQLLPDFNLTTDNYGPNSITLKGIPSSPSVKVINSFDSLEYLNGVIPNGTIYKFTKVSGTVSIQENVNTFKTRIFPNPANNFIHVVSENNKTSISQIQIMDLSGKVVRTINSQFNQIDISELNSGIYMVNVFSSDGGSTNSKFVKN